MPDVPALPISHDFHVRTRDASDPAAPRASWTDRFVHEVRVNLFNLSNAGLVTFVAAGDIDVEVTVTDREFTNAAIMPASLDVAIEREENVLRFTLPTDRHVPPKCILTLDGDLDRCLHILPTAAEVDPPQPSDENVCVVQPGETPIPLPDGCDTWYFAPGIHTGDHLGAWLELDLGEPTELNRLTLTPIDHAHHLRLYARDDLRSGYRLITEITDNRSHAPIDHTFTPTTARYVKVQFDHNPRERYPYAIHASRLSLFGPASDTDLAPAPGTFRIASHDALARLVDDDPATSVDMKNVGGRFHFYADHQRMYVHPDAVITGGIRAHDLAHIQIIGRGILDARPMAHTVNNDRHRRVGPLIAVKDCPHTTIEGLTIIDSPAWTLHLTSDHLRVRDLNIIGWFFNSDGIDLKNCSDAIIEDCFIRAGDDLIVINVGDTTLVRRCTLLSDKAHVVLTGLMPGTVRDITFRDIEVLGSHEPDDIFQGVMTIHSANGNIAENLTFENWNIAPFRRPDRARVIVIHMDLSTPWCHTPGGRVENITFKNIHYAGNGELPSQINGVDLDRRVKNVRILGYRRHGQPATDPTTANLDLGPFTENVNVNE